MVDGPPGLLANASIAPFRATTYALSGGLTLTVMTPEEAAAFGDICAAIDPWLSYPFTSDQLTAFFTVEDPTAPRFTARLSGELAGALAIRRDWLRGPYIHMLAVAPKFQGGGAGSALLSWVEAQSRAAGDRNLWIAVTDTNTGAQRLYARHGFVETARLDGLVLDGRTEFLMRKRLYASG